MPSHPRPRPVQSGEGLRVPRHRWMPWGPSPEIPEGDSRGGRGEDENEGNAGLAVRLQEGLPEAEIQEQGHQIKTEGRGPQSSDPQVSEAVASRGRRGRWNRPSARV